MHIFVKLLDFGIRFGMIIGLFVYFARLYFQRKNGNSIVFTTYKSQQKFLTFAFWLIVLGRCMLWTQRIILKDYHSFRFTDLCNMLCLLVIVFHFTGNTRFRKTIAFWAIFGGVISIAGRTTNFFGIAENAGVGETRMWFIYNSFDTVFAHFGLISYGLGTIYTYKMDDRDKVNSMLFFIIFILWILVIAGIPYYVTGDKKWGAYTTGILPPSFEPVTMSPKLAPEGDYVVMTKVLPMLKDKTWIITLGGYAITISSWWMSTKWIMHIQNIMSNSLHFESVPIVAKKSYIYFDQN